MTVEYQLSDDLTPEQLDKLARHYEKKAKEEERLREEAKLSKYKDPAMEKKYRKIEGLRARKKELEEKIEGLSDRDLQKYEKLGEYRKQQQEMQEAIEPILEIGREREKAKAKEIQERVRKNTEKLAKLSKSSRLNKTRIRFKRELEADTKILVDLGILSERYLKKFDK